MSNDHTGRPDAPDIDDVAREAPEAALVLRRVSDLLGTLETALLVALVTVLIAGASYQVVTDWFLHRNETWPYELIRYAVFFVAMTGAALASQRRGMFHMDLVTRMLPARVRVWLRILTAVLAVLLCALVMKSGLDLRRGSYEVHEGFEIISPAQGYVALVVAFGLIGLHYLLHAAIEIAYLAAGRLPPEPPHGGH